VARLCKLVKEALNAIVKIKLEEGSRGETLKLVIKIAFREEG
jgi:hypothetical protein